MPVCGQRGAGDSAGPTAQAAGGSPLFIKGAPGRNGNGDGRNDLERAARMHAIRGAISCRPDRAGAGKPTIAPERSETTVGSEGAWRRIGCDGLVAPGVAAQGVALGGDAATLCLLCLLREASARYTTQY